MAATTAAAPVFDGKDVSPGTHITGVGSFTPEMQEIDASLIRRAYVVVDGREGAKAEAGDLIMAGASIDAELGEIINGDKPGRRTTNRSPSLNRSEWRPRTRLRLRPS
jgi:ornithine cyclodeaminase/alanine dehydrogenase-like protein (mu-crystallin family)